MSDTTTEEIIANSVPGEATGAELAAIGLVRRIPGLGGLSNSRRVLKAFRGGSWTMAGYGAGQVLRLASTLVLARLVAPQAFGLVALVNVFLSGLESLSDLGIGMDVIQHRRGDDPVFINTAFIIQMVRGTIIWGVAAALSYPFAIFYHQPAVLALAIVGSLSTLIRGFSSGSIWTLTRHVRLKELTILNTGTDMFGLVVSVVWALISPTAWALVAGRVAASFAFTVASHVIAEKQVSLAWDWKGAKEIFAFGTGIFVSTATYFLAGEAERLVVGKFVNLVELGCFSLALSLSTAGSRAIQQVLSQVFFPMMSDSIRQDPAAAFRHYRKTRHLILIICSCMSFGFIVGSHWLVHILLGQKYAETGWMLQLLGARAALDVFAGVAATMLFAVGTSRFAAIGNISKLAFLGVGLSIAFGRYGFHGAMWVLAFAPLANYIPMLIGLRRKCAPVFRDELLSFTGFTAATALGAVIFWAIK
jgi:O-antigen/teichoic acid export membrane protein